MYCLVYLPPGSILLLPDVAINRPGHVSRRQFPANTPRATAPPIDFRLTSEDPNHNRKFRPFARTRSPSSPRLRPRPCKHVAVRAGRRCLWRYAISLPPIYTQFDFVSDSLTRCSRQAAASGYGQGSSTSSAGQPPNVREPIPIITTCEHMLRPSSRPTGHLSQDYLAKTHDDPSRRRQKWR